MSADDLEFDVTDTGIIGDMGVALARLRCGQMGHLFRDQPTHDRGIDAEIELADGSTATGRIIKAQVKCGSSYFARSEEEFFTVPINRKHYEHWKKHSVPVIFLLANHRTDECFWALINDQSTRSTGRNFVIRVPRSQIFDKTSRAKIAEIATPLVPPQKFEIFDKQDTSTGSVRRLSYYISLKPAATGWTKPDIEQLIRQVTAEARGSRYFRDHITESRWSGTHPAVVWVFVYFDEKHRDIGEYLAKAVWIEPTLDEEFRPIGFSSPIDSTGLQIEWNHGFGNVIEAIAEHTADKATYVNEAYSLVTESFDITFKYWGLVAVGSSSSRHYSKDLFADFSRLIKMIDDLPIAPLSCARVSKQIGVLFDELNSARDLAVRDGDHSRKDNDFKLVDEHIQQAYFKTHLVRHELDELA